MSTCAAASQIVASHRRLGSLAAMPYDLLPGRRSGVDCPMSAPASALALRFAAALLLAIGAFTVPAPTEAQAQTYPQRVVRIVNPFPPGGSVDTMARILAQKLTENLGHQFIVDNRAGA